MDHEIDCRRKRNKRLFCNGYKGNKTIKEKNNLFYLTFVLPFFYYYLIVSLKLQKNSHFLYYY